MNLNQIEIKIIMKFPLYCFILWTPYDLKNKNKACSSLLILVINFLFIILILSCRNQCYGCFTWKLFSRVTSKQMKCCCPLHCIVLLLVWSLDRSNVREFDVLWYIFERDEGRNSGRHPVIKSVETACFIFIFQIVGCP
jgi:hypothetical protein